MSITAVPPAMARTDESSGSSNPIASRSERGSAISNGVIAPPFPSPCVRLLSSYSSGKDVVPLLLQLAQVGRVGLSDFGKIVEPFVRAAGINDGARIERRLTGAQHRL